MTTPRVRTNAILFVLMTIIGLLLFSTTALDDFARMRHGSELPHFIEEMTGAYTVLPLIAGLRWVARRYPIGRTSWRTGLPVALLAMGGYTAAHTTLMLVTRAQLFPLLGLGAYDYGIMLFRYPMEAAKDVLSFGIIYGSIGIFDRLERGRAAEVAAADLETELVQARLENLRLQLHPHFLFNTLNAISAVMYEDVRKADEMLVKLSVRSFRSCWRRRATRSAMPGAYSFPTMVGRFSSPSPIFCGSNRTAITFTSTPNAGFTRCGRHSNRSRRAWIPRTSRASIARRS